MKTLIIATHDESEFDKFNGTITSLANGVVRKKVSSNNELQIILYNNTDTVYDVNSIISDINTFTDEKIILHHGIDNLSLDSFNVSSTVTNGDRQQYETLFNAEDKWTVFDGVWEYFSNKNDTNALLEAKLNLLHLCLTPDGIPTSINEVLNECVPEFLAFKDAVQGKTNAFDESYTQTLAEFRDKLLT